MPYLGNNPTANFATVTKDTFSGNGSTTAFTLSKPATTNGVAVYVENVRQIPTTAYSVSGTTLTFTAAPVSGTNNIYVMHHNTPVSTATHPSTQALQATSGTFTADVTLSGDLSSGLNKSIDLRDNDGHVSGRLRNISSSKNALVIEADPDNSGSNSNLRFYIDGSEQAIIDHNYDFKVNNGDIFFGTAGKGIVLGATSNTNANTLDDYEEGTFTFGSNANIGFNSNTNVGKYTKIGNMVHLQMYVDVSSVSSTNHFYLSGMPFTASANTTNTSNGISTGTCMIYDVNTYYSAAKFHSYIGNESNNMYFYESSDNVSWLIVTNSRINSSTDIIISHTYFV